MTNKFQTGGQVFFSAVANPYSNAAVQDRAMSAAAKSSSKSEQSIIPKEVMADLYKKGIPVDVDHFYNQLASFERRIDRGLPVNKSMVYQLQAEANRIIQQADYLKSAENQAVKNEALGEIAVGSRGQLFVMDDTSKVKQISAQQFDAEKMTALTVGELIELRKYSPSYALDESIIPVVRSNIGMSQINEKIQNIIKIVGQNTSTTEAYIDLQSYIGREAAKKPTQQQLEQLQSLASVMEQLGPDAIFKNKQVLSSKNMELALNYVESVLPNDIKKQLISRNIANGYSYRESVNNMHQLIITACAASNDIKTENSLDYDASLNKAAGTQSGSKLEQKRNLKQLDVLIQGSLNKIDYKLVSKKNPSMGMILHGNEIGALTNFDNNIVPKAPMSIALESSIGPLIDKNHVTMGSQKISESMFDTILYDGNDVLNIWAPTDSDGNIDLMGLKQFNDILDYFESDPSLSIQDKNNILAQYGISGKIDESGNFVGSGNMSQFLVFTGITSDDVIDKNDIFADILDSDQKKYELDQIERIYGYLNGKNKNKKGNLEFKKGWFNWTTDIIKAPVFMKLKSTAKTQVGAFGNHGPLVNTPTYHDQVAMDQMRYDAQYSQTINKPSTSLLYQNYE